MQLLYKVQPGQTLSDVCMQVYGTLDYLYKLANDNGLGLNVAASEILGEYLSYDNSLTFNPIVFNKNKNRGIVYCTDTNNPFAISGGSFDGSFDDSFEGGG